MKRILVLLLITAMILGCIGCSSTNEDSTPKSEMELKAGSYTGTAAGMWGDITMKVTLDDQSITEVALVSGSDTKHLLEAAVNEISEKVITNQSFNVDGVTGATISSFGIKQAIKAALDTAGAADYFSSEILKSEKEETSDEYYDLVVVGGGGSGLTAASYAKNNGVESVLVLEKMGWTGGSTSLSGGGSIVGGSRYNELAKVDYSPEEYLNFFRNAAENAENRPSDMWINEDLVLKIGSLSGDTFDTFMDNGFPFPDEFWSNPAHAAVWGDWGKLDEGRGMISFNSNAGELYSYWLTDYAKKSGAEIRVNSTVTELIIENGAVTGVKVSDPDSTYTVHAKKVILASGGMEGNSELVEKYAPEAVGMSLYAAAGNTGDFVALTEPLNPVITGYGSVGQAGPDRGHSSIYGTSLMGYSMVVNHKGARFFEEDSKYYRRARAISNVEGGFAWGIADSNNPFVEYIEKDIQAGVLNTYKADTIEELAELINVPVEALVQSQKEFHDEYLADPDPLTRPLGACAKYDVNEGPFYAQSIYPLLMFTLTGLEVDDQCHVLNDNGNVIMNLFAVGEIVFGNCFYDEYVIGSSAVQIAINSGRIAGESAAEEILEK